MKANTQLSLSFAKPLLTRSQLLQPAPVAVVLLGTVAGRFPDRKLRWDSEAMRFDDPDANRFVGRTYRKGWEIEGV